MAYMREVLYQDNLIRIEVCMEEGKEARTLGLTSVGTL